MINWKDVIQTLESNKYRWRTIRGISKELKVTEQEILHLIQQHQDEIIKLSVPADTGEDLYTTRKHYNANATPYAQVINSLTQAVSGVDSSSITTIDIQKKEGRKK